MTTTRRLSGTSIALVATLLLSTLAFAATAMPAAAEQLTVTFEIYRVAQGESPDGDGGNGDYFPRVKIGSGPTQSAPYITGNAFDVDWKFNQTVDTAAGHIVPISVQLMDYDDTAAGGDDVLDINPRNDDVELNLFYDVFAQTWSGDLADSLDEAIGDGDHGFPAANDGRIAGILFGISTIGTTDADGDGIPDGVERFGIRRPNGEMVWNQGMDPCRKTILLQIDWMSGAADGHDHEPKGPALDEVRASFNAAPVDPVTPCPYGGADRPDGIDFVFIPGKAIEEKPVMNFGPEFSAARDANFDRELRPYAHYAIFLHDQEPGSSASGLCCDDIGLDRDFFVSLGSWRTECVIGRGTKLDTAPAVDDQAVNGTIFVGENRTCDTTKAGDDEQILRVGTGAENAYVGTVRDQSGTIMHEIGHSLGLGHGGSDEVNYKPNYLSVMNYSFGPEGITIDGSGGTRLDYSREPLPELKESALSESAGIGAARPDFTRWRDASGNEKLGRGNAPLNWNGNTTPERLPIIDTANVSVDLNPHDDSGVDTDTLTGWEDWNNLKFRGVAALGGAGVSREHGRDITFKEALTRELARNAFFDPDLATTKTVDHDHAEPGDTLKYAVEAKNVGTGTATAVSVVDTFPDGSTAKRSPADIAAGHARTESFTYTIPCATKNLTTLTNSATVSAKDLGDSPETNTSNNTGSASTIVHAPQLTLAASAPATVVAGEEMAMNLTVANVGSGGATNVVLTDTLPADVYYSPGLDTGSGPKPNSVTRNADGSTTLTWTLGALAGGASTTINFTARPSLLFVGGSTLVQDAAVAYGNANGCVYDPTIASATTSVTEVTPTEDPLSAGYWKTHEADRTPELLARIQATDQRFDGIDGSTPDGVLSDAEAYATLSSGGRQPGPLHTQELAVLFDLASRRINASTRIEGKLPSRLGTQNVRDAVLFGMATLGEPWNSSNADRYSDATTLLDQIANNKVEAY